MIGDDQRGMARDLEVASGRRGLEISKVVSQSRIKHDVGIGISDVHATSAGERINFS